LNFIASKHPRQPFAVNYLQVLAIDEFVPFGVCTSCEDVINRASRPEATSMLYSSIFERNVVGFTEPTMPP
jgi:hypothetical protein